MIHLRRRCWHCQVRYLQPSRGTGDDRFCPDCLQVVREALAKVPKRAEKVRTVVTDPPFELVKQWSEEDLKAAEERRALGHTVLTRVFPGLVDLDDYDNQHIQRHVVGRDKWDGQEFVISFWTKNGHSEVTTMMERDVATGRLTPWWQER